MRRQRWDIAQAAGEAIQEGLSTQSGERNEDDVAADALDQGADGGQATSALDEVALPMTGHDASSDLGWAQGNGGHARQLGRASSATARPAAFRGSRQLGDQLAAQSATGHGIDGAVDRLVAHVGGMAQVAAGNEERASQSASDLLRRAMCSQALKDMQPGRAGHVRAELAPSQAGAAAAGCIKPLTKVGDIGRQAEGLSAADLAGDGAAMEAEQASNS